MADTRSYALAELTDITFVNPKYFGYDEDGPVTVIEARWDGIPIRMRALVSDDRIELPVLHYKTPDGYRAWAKPSSLVLNALLSFAHYAEGLDLPTKGGK
jgi:hypothetical protein